MTRPDQFSVKSVDWHAGQTLPEVRVLHARQANSLGITTLPLNWVSAQPTWLWPGLLQSIPVRPA
jgi:hypothetical protein